MRIPEKVRQELKEPLGLVHKDFTGIMQLARTRRIISIGDICTLSLLAMGIRPHLAVFDFRYMRKKLDSGLVSILSLNFKDPRRYPNPPGTVSEKVMEDAKELLRDGGGVLIDGEEDLLALIFIRSAGKGDLIIYGQPHEGLVVVEPDKEIKDRIGRWLASAMPL